MDRALIYSSAAYVLTAVLTALRPLRAAAAGALAICTAHAFLDGSRYIVLLTVLLALAQAGAEEGVPPRRAYNLARADFDKGDLAAAEKGFLAARDGAGADADLRYRAAFNLGLTLARKADGLSGQKPQEAVAALSQAAAWFRDAVRAQLDGNDDARVNLEIVLGRMRALSDKLTQGQNSLEARLQRVIQDERTLRDRVRGLLARVRQAGAASEPLQFQGEFDESAAFQRTLLGDAGAILDLAGDGRDRIQAQPADKRSDEDRGRLVQLENLEHYLNQARGTMADTGRLLRRLQGDRAHGKADQALTELKRALEQMLDPVTVLKGLAADQDGLLRQTQVLDALRRGTLSLGDKQKEGPPPWQTAPALGEAQRGLQPRAQELLARLKAGTERASAEPRSSQQPQGPDEARKARVLQAAREAIPGIEAAVSAMDRAGASLVGDLLEPAARAQAEAMTGLLLALERFSGVRELIELSYGDQAQIVALLVPPGDKDRDAAKQGAALQALSTKERADLLAQGTARNLERISRLKGLLAEELLTQPQSKDADPKKAEAAAARLKLAEEHRAKAEVALARLAGQLRSRAAGARAPATEALGEIEALRRLYFTLVEHLKEVLREQVETHDGTGAAQALKDEEEKRRRLGPLSQGQARHAGLARALGEALSAQADQAGQPGQPGQPGQDDPQAAETQKRLGEAAEEVRKGAGEMDGAAGRLERDLKEPVSPDLEPVLAHQKLAITHLEQALRILEPPQEQPPKDQKDQKDQKDDQKQEQQQVSQEQAARRLQAIREREADRQRTRQKKAAPEPVEKDW